VVGFLAGMGYTPAGFVSNTGLIIKLVADKEFGMNFNHEEINSVVNSNGAEKFGRVITKEEFYYENIRWMGRGMKVKRVIDTGYHYYPKITFTPYSK
jgi:hypothetical protein